MIDSPQETKKARINDVQQEEKLIIANPSKTFYGLNPNYRPAGFKTPKQLSHMSSILQCLVHTPQFSDQIMSLRNFGDTDNMIQYLRLLIHQCRNLGNTGSKICKPALHLSRIYGNEVASIFEVHRTKDACFYLQRLISILHADILNADRVQYSNTATLISKSFPFTVLSVRSCRHCASRLPSKRSVSPVLSLQIPRNNVCNFQQIIDVQLARTFELCDTTCHQCRGIGKVRKNYLCTVRIHCFMRYSIFIYYVFFSFFLAGIFIAVYKRLLEIFDFQYLEKFRIRIAMVVKYACMYV